ncbi:ABC transporter ATP-binding protein [Pseudobacillus sp. 179-B 2D1 NHS]|uniref:ABC transporter ATP-binding protein n=1 Tax=Pseudobacillus sp. 179-B 2D1 NHS TaxID=3374292 RepID=UPI0038794B2F
MNNVNYFYQAAQFVWRIDKGWVINSVFLRIIGGIIPILGVVLLEKLVKNVQQLLLNGGPIHKELYFILASQIIIFSLQAGFVNINNLLDGKIEIKLEYEINKLVNTKAANSPAYYYDNPDFYNHLERTKYSRSQQFLNPLINFLDIFQNLITVSSFTILLINTHWLLAIICLVSVMPVYFIERKFGLKQFLLLKYQTPISREFQYLDSLLSNRDSIQEIKIFNAQDYIIKKSASLFLKKSKEELNYLKKRETSYFLLKFLNNFALVIGVLLLITMVTSKKLALSTFIAVFQAIRETQTILLNLSNNFSTIQSQMHFLKDLFELLYFEDKTYIKGNSNTVSFPEFKDQGIKITNLSFVYPYSNRKVLSDVSLDIHPGETIAIVGENGSGKSTLIKCLMGLYPIMDGDILFEGISIKTIDELELLKNITVLFQNFTKYNLTLKENILLNDSLKENDIEKFQDVIRLSGVKDFYKKLEEGAETRLGKLFLDGEELSGGQWQKVAIARALFKKGELFILDEPTAALDPRSEYDIFKKFKMMTENKTTIFVTHRMTATKLADQIVVMKNGKIIEKGNHNELMMKKGEYYKLYKMQNKLLEENYSYPIT